MFKSDKNKNNFDLQGYCISTPLCCLSLYQSHFENLILSIKSALNDMYYQPSQLRNIFIYQKLLSRKKLIYFILYRLRHEELSGCQSVTRCSLETSVGTIGDQSVSLHYRTQHFQNNNLLLPYLCRFRFKTYLRPNEIFEIFQMRFLQ